MLQRVCRIFRLSVLNKDTIPVFTQQFKQSPTFYTVKPYIRWENNPVLLQLAIRTELPLQDRYMLLEEMDKVAKLETEQDLNISANIKKHLSISYLSRRNFEKAIECAEDGLKILRMMENPHPVELASLIHNLAETYLARQPSDEKGLKSLNEAITLFEEAHKLEPENYLVLNNLAYCYSRLTWCYLFGTDVFKAREACAKAESFWPKINQKNRNYAYFIQGKCILLDRLKETDKLVEECSRMVKYVQDPYSRVWFLHMLLSKNKNEYKQQYTNDMETLQKNMKKEHFESFKNMIESLR